MKIIRRFLPVLFALTGGLTPVFAQTAIDLGTAANFSILGGAGITFSGATTLTGDIGTFPTATIVNAGNASFVSGSNHAGDAFTQTAKTDLAAAYADAAGRVVNLTVGTQLGGTILAPGVYDSVAGTFAITGNLTLNGSGVYVFKMLSTLDTAIGSQVLLSGGAQAANVFWQVGTSATFLASSVFVGNVLASTSITAGIGTVVDGRLLAQNGSVTMGGTNTVTAPAAIPEPAATAAMVAGLMGLIIGIRRIRRTRGSPAAT